MTSVPDKAEQVFQTQSELESLRRSLDGMVDWQRRVVEISNDLLEAHSDNIDTAINQALMQTGKLALSDRTYVFRLRDPDRIDNTHEWVADGIDPMMDHLQDLSDDLLVDWRDDLATGHQVYIPDVTSLPDTSIVRDVLLEQGIRSLLAVPMRRNGQLRGFVGYDSVRKHRVFRQPEIELIQSVANTINALMERAGAEAAAEAVRAHLEIESGKLRATLAAIPDLLLELDCDGRFLDEHAGVLLQPFLPRDSFIGRLPEEVLNAELAALVRDIMAEIDRDGRSGGREYHLELPGGKNWFQVSAGAKSSGQKGGYVFLIRDITESRDQQLEILRFGKVAEVTSNLVIVTDAKDRIEWVNPAFERRSGWTLKEVLGLRPKSFLQAGISDIGARDLIGAAIAKGEAFRGELLNKSRSGEEYWTDIDITPLRDEAGTLSGFVAVQTDISDLKRSHERELQELAVAIDESADGIQLSDAEGRFTYMNSAFRDLFGIGADQGIGAMNWRELFPTATFIDDAGKALRISGDVWRGQTIGRRRNGDELTLEISLTRREEGGTVLIARDISERIQQEMERARLRDELHHAQRKETIAHLATDVAHDLNNLIAVVEGTANILEAHADTETEVRTGADRIRRAMQTARDLVASLGSLDRSGAPRAVHDLRRLLEQGAEILGSRRIADNNVTVANPDESIPVWGTATDILQVITNLAINACDAKADRPNRVEMSVLSQSAAATARSPDVGEYRPDVAYSLFAVSDTGTGILPANRGRLFDRYFSTKGKEGTGLGMPIVASILRDNDAALWLDTAPGKGSLVTVAWPAAPDSGAKPATRFKRPSASVDL